jgi:hypothetical protein
MTEQALKKVIRLHQPIRTHIPTNGASLLVIWRSRVIAWIGGVMNKIGLPGLVGQMKFYDEVTDQEVSIRTTRRFTIFSVGDRDYYFYRLTGKTGGTGSNNPND